MKHKNSRTRRLAKLLVKHANNVLPPERGNWAQAMRNEIDHLPDDKSALKWAIGCIYTSYVERMTNMNTGNLQVSRAVLIGEMLMCFGFISLSLLASLIGVENFQPIDYSFITLLIFSAFLIGPIGLIFSFRLIVLNRTYLSKAMIAVLVIPGAWTLIVSGIALPIYAAVTPNHSWGWDGIIMAAILPTLGVAHLIYMSKPAGKMKIAA